ncbi:pentatricopeptide repeat-containing protein 2, mitochondrial-like [Ruditapes philippinarum]|uniref:pentatricopeptide repeat-containing protein 2, mitochondrial-like n=1 Tax=Ruditapes philippinarum TaxID=129788 RepID=UPI00295BB8DE|nr:pentatricopeptide repeat-containing protein 2, mitochondrial-like [Ruditapes philippinarum]
MLKFCRRILYSWTFITPSHNNVIKRYLISPGPLGLVQFDEDRRLCRKKIYHMKDQFLRNLGEKLGDGEYIFKEDVAALLYLTDKNDDFDFVSEVIRRYQKLVKKKTFIKEYPVGAVVLQMLYINEREDLAFKMFLHEEKSINSLYRHRECFMIMMDMLYEKEQFEDIISLIYTCENYIGKMPEIVNIVLASFYRMNSKESLQQMLNYLNELTNDPWQLSNRCAMLCCMLAYKQGEIELSLEMIQLPIFEVNRKKLVSPIDNIKILAYIELGRVEDAVEILKDAMINYPQPANLFFDDVLTVLETAVHELGDKEFEATYQEISSSLRGSGFVFPSLLEHYILRPISFKEFSRLCGANNIYMKHYRQSKERSYTDLT